MTVVFRGIREFKNKVMKKKKVMQIIGELLQILLEQRHEEKPAEARKPFSSIVEQSPDDVARR